MKLLQPERYRNVEIILTKLKIPEGEIQKALLSCSGKYASSLVLEAVNKILPTDDEQ